MGTDEAFSLPRSYLSLLSFGGSASFSSGRSSGEEVKKGKSPKVLCLGLGTLGNFPFY